jgi:hypothetical protein
VRRGDVEELIALGRVFDEPSPALGGTTAGFLAETLLRVRTRQGGISPLRPNRAQREYERRRGRANVVLKARQMGMTTWVAGRFFLKTITQPGTLSLLVAHTQEAAEEIFRVVRRFHALLPEELRSGALRTSRDSACSLVFPELDSEYRVETAGDPNAGRGLTVQNLHCSEVARWPGDARLTLGGLLAATPAGGERLGEALLPLVVGDELPAAARRAGGDGGGADTGRGARSERGADRIPASPAAAVRSARTPGVSGERGGLLSAERTLRL